ncbi:MAG: glycosyltransferase [Thermoflexaceae bacterium]|nr:glycosyltransferase [Thermoflexaceae bacterium]
MNILLVNTTYQGGGAEKVTRQLFHGFDNTDIQMHLLVGRGDPSDSSYEIIYDKKIPYFFSRAYGKLAPYRKYDRYATKRIIDTVKKYHIDIVHLQNIHGNYMGIRDVAKISRHCRVIWTLHDMWALTGHCAHAFDCTKWIDGNCTGCPKPETYPSIRTDIAGRMLDTKKKSFSGNRIVYVSPSRWLYDRFKESFLKDETIEVIHNGIDIHNFMPGDVILLREKYNIPQDKHVLLFAASNLNSQFRSFKHLLMALELLENKSGYCLVVLGNCDDQITFPPEFQVMQMGYVTDEKKMNELYALSDAYITPSLADNFPCTTLESFASGTPVIAFATGGLIEQIDPSTGWLVECGNPKALADAIQTAFTDEARLATMRENCRKKAEELYSEELMLEKYKALYQKVYKGEL